MQLDAGQHAIERLSNGNYLIKTSMDTFDHYAELEGVEFISGPSGDRLELVEGMFSF